MKLNEIITEKERVDEVAWFIPPIVKGLMALKGASGATGAATTAGKAAATVIAKTAPKAGIANKIRQWTSKAPPDSSTPDALKGDKVGYGPDQVDPPLAKAAARKQSVVEPKDKVTTKARTNVGPMSKLQRATT